MTEIVKQIEDLGRDWSEFKGAMNQRLSAVEQGKGTAELDAKIAKIDASVAANQKAADDYAVERKALAERISQLEATRDSIGSTKLNEKTALNEQHMELFNTWLRTGQKAGPAADALKSFELKLGAANVSTTSAAGGYAIPEILHNVISEQELKISPVRQEITIVQAANADFRVLVDATNTSSGWVAETDARTATLTSNLVERVPTFGTLYSFVSATEESLNDIGFDVAAWIGRGIAMEMAKAEGNAFLLGNGSKKPTGLLNTSPTNVGEHSSPARAAAAFEYIELDPGASPPATIQANALFDLFYGLTSGYRANAKLYGNSNTIALIRKLRSLTSTTGEYLWQPSMIVGQPSTVGGYPVVCFEDLADIAASANALVFGDLKRAYIGVDIQGLRTSIDDNITVPGYVKWYVRKRLGGCVLDNNAVKVGKISKT